MRNVGAPNRVFSKLPPKYNNIRARIVESRHRERHASVKSARENEHRQLSEPGCETSGISLLKGGYTLY